MKDSINWFMQKCAQSKENTLWTKMQSGYRNHFRNPYNGIPLPERPKQPPKWGGQNEEPAFPDFPRIGDRPNKDPTGPGDDDEWKSWKEYEEEQRYKQWREWREKRKRERPNRFNPFLTDPSEMKPFIPTKPSPADLIEKMWPKLKPHERVPPYLNPVLQNDPLLPTRPAPSTYIGYFDGPTRPAISPLEFLSRDPTRPAIHFDNKRTLRNF